MSKEAVPRIAVGAARDVAAALAMDGANRGRHHRRFARALACTAIAIASSIACSPAGIVAYSQNASVDYCIRKSCTGPVPVQDFARCQAICRERYGQ
jgi:hypothetical protein